MPIQVNTLARHIGRTYTLKAREGFIITVDSIDARIIHGQVVLLVSPYAGSGEAWINLERLQEVKI